MTDILLGLILVFVVLLWTEHSPWLARRTTKARKLGRKIGKKVRNWRARRRQLEEK